MKAPLGSELRALNDPKSVQFNVGASYAHGQGTTMLAYNHKGQFTASHVGQVPGTPVSAGIELVQAVGTGVGAVRNPVTVAAAYQVDPQHVVKGRINKAGEVNVCLEKALSSKFTMAFATVFDFSNPDSLFRVPAFGVKVSASKY